MRLEKSIETSRFVLQTLDLSFVSENYLSWLNSDEVNQYLETRFSPQTQESLTAFVEQMLKSQNSALLQLFPKNPTNISGISNSDLSMRPTTPHHSV